MDMDMMGLAAAMSGGNGSEINTISTDDLFSALLDIVGEEGLLKDVPMSEYTTFKTGGNADLMIKPASVEQLSAVMQLINLGKVPYIILGNGSDTLITDKGFRGAVVMIGRDMGRIAIRGSSIRVGAGALMSSVSNAAYEAGLTGMEFASGIPGSVGGCLYMNAGAYGGEMKDIVTDALVVTRDGNVEMYFDDDMELGYRESIFQHDGSVIVEVGIELKPGDKEEIGALIKDYTDRRNEKQPLNLPSAGSTFKRPEGHFAGALIEEAGLKGTSVGGAMVSEKHAGFIVNTGNATSSDIIALIEKVKEEVFKNSGVMLEPEVRIFGE